MKEMLLFEVCPNDDGALSASLINATHRWGLPGIKCSACGNTWSSTGLAYPLVDLSHLPFERDYRTPRAVPLKEFDFLKKRLLSSLSLRTLVLPGTEFGPLMGNAQGKFGDFAWLNPWTLLMKDHSYERLHDAGVRLPLASSSHNLTFREKDHDSLLELQIEPHASLRSESQPSGSVSRCSACQYTPLQLPNRIVVERLSIPQKLDLFRSKEFTTLILATEDFVRVARALKLTGIKFNEVAVSPN